MSAARRAALTALAAASLLAAPALAATREVKKSVPARPGLTVALTNLVGEVRAESSSGADVEIVATVHAEGSEEEKLLASVRVDFEERGDTFAATAHYPLEEYGRIRYPGPESGRHDWFGLNRTTVTYQGRRVTVTTGRSGAVTMWVDFTVRLPQGVALAARNSVGRLIARDVNAAVELESDSGDIRATGGAGRLRAKTGSGDVALRDRAGDVDVHTGSGDVEVVHVTGNAEVGTGSGDVVLREVDAKAVKASTGSGSVRLDRVAGSLDAGTGSGEIRGSGLARAERVHAETGSGDISLEGDLSEVKGLDVSTGSGDVVLRLDKSFPMRLRAKTSSGEIDVDLPSLRTIRRKEHELVAEVGAGGADVEIGTSSGNVRVVVR